MPGKDSTEVTIVDLRPDAMQARRKEGQARRTLRNGIVFKTLLTALVILAALGVLLAVLSR